MSRIRTIKPEFFTSEDIVALSPLARLLYIALWCEADKEGRMKWSPKTFKMRYLPAEKCDIDALCDELLKAGLVVEYGPGLAFIPKFREHQHINPRETDSRFPVPPEFVTRQARVSDASVTHREEGKGREGNILSAVADRVPAESDGRHKRTVDLFCRLWSAKTGVEYAFQGGKDGKAVQAILKRKDATDTEIERRIQAALADPFFVKAGSLALFAARWANYGALAAQYQPAPGPSPQRGFDPALDGDPYEQQEREEMARRAARSANAHG